LNLPPENSAAQTQNSSRGGIAAQPPVAVPRSLGERILHATLAIMAAHAMAKLLGLVQARVIGHYYGFGAENDVFVLVFNNLLWAMFLIGEEALGPAFLPVFMESREKESEEAAWRFTTTLSMIQFLLLFAAVVLLMSFPEHAVALFSRFERSGAGGVSRSALAIHFLQGMAPALIGLSMGSLTYMVLNGYKRFFWPAFADAALKGALALGIVLGRYAGLDSDALIAGVLAAGITKITVHVLALRDKLGLVRAGFHPRDANFHKFANLVAPLLVGILFAKFRDYFNNAWIISALEPGLLSVNDYGRKIYSAVGWLVPYPLSIALFPFFCELVARDDRQALADFLTRTSRMLLLVFLPLTAVIVVLSVPLAQALFQTGKVTAADAALAGQVNACYSLVIPFYALETVLMQAYFSTRRMVSVTLIGMFFSALSMGVSAVGIFVYGLTGMEALTCIALGWTASRALKTLTLIAVLRGTGLPLLPVLPLAAFLFRAVLLTAACGLAAYGTLHVVEAALPASTVVEAPPRLEEGKTGVPAEDGKTGADSGESKTKTAAKTGFEAKTSEAAAEAKDPAKLPAGGSGFKALLRAAPKLAAPGLAALAVFLLGCKLLRFEELDLMVAYAREKLRRRKEKRSA